MPLDKEFYYRDFKQAVAIKLNDLIKQLHLAYQKRNDHIVNIKDNIKHYNNAKLDVSPIFEIDPSDRININKSGYHKLSIKLRSYIASYNYLVYEKIPNLKKSIQTFAAVHNCTREFYSPFSKYITHEIARHLLKGNAYSLGEKIGYLKVYIQKFDNPYHGLYNLKESYALRKKLIDAGVDVQSDTNPNGIKWKVFLDQDWWCRARFRTYKNSVLNSKNYRFRWGWTADVGYNNTPNYHQDDTYEEILNNYSMNFLNKLLTICFNFPDLKWELYQNNLTKDTTKNYDEQSIICE